MMSATHTWACLLLWVSFATQDKTPDATVTCLVSEECVLPCKFEPGGKEAVQWFRQDEEVYSYSPEADKDGGGGRSDDDDDGGGRSDKDDDDDDDDDSNSSEDHVAHRQLDGRASIFPHLVSQGNATLIIKEAGLKDRGTYRCHVRTSNGEHSSRVILKMEAPIRGLSLELSRLSGYEEMKCTVRDVFPAPRVSWATEPPTFEDLRPITRMLPDKRGLYTVDSRLRRLNGQPDLIYICKVMTPYGGPAWSSSLRERGAIRGSEGKDLTIPCSAPPYLSSPFLSWTFDNGEDPAHILSYDSKTGHTVSLPPWGDHVELDGFRVPFGDGSLRLMDPEHAQHTGSYACVFTVPYGTHTERTDVAIDTSVANRSTAKDSSYWWVVALVLAALILALVGMLACLRLRGGAAKPAGDPEDETELHSVKETTTYGHLSESRPLTAGGANGQSDPQAGPPLT